METEGLQTGNQSWKSLYRIGAVAPLITLAFYLTQLFAIIFSKDKYPTTPEEWFNLFGRNKILGLILLNALDVFSIAILGLMFLALYIALRGQNPSYMVIAAFFAFLGIGIFVSSRTEMVAATLTLSEQYATATTEAPRSQVLAAGQAVSALSRATPETIGFLFMAVAGLISSLVALQAGAFGKALAYVGILAGVITFANQLCLILAPAIAGFLLPLNGLLWLVWWLLVSRELYKLSNHPS